MSKLIILIGGVGSGKSTFAKKLGGKTVSSDSVRKVLYGNESVIFNEEISEMLINEKGISPCTMSSEKLKQLKQELCEDYVFVVARRKCCDLLKNGYDVVYDSTNFKKKYRRQLLLEAEGLYDSCEAFVMDVPVEIAIKRNGLRERKEPESIIRAIYSQIVLPDYSEGFNKIYMVDQKMNIRLVPKK